MVHGAAEKILSITEYIKENMYLSAVIVCVIIIFLLIIAFLSMRGRLKKQEVKLKDLKIQEEKYRVLAELSNDIIFDYDIYADQMMYSEKYEENFGRKPTIERFAELKEEAQYIYKEDVKILIKSRVQIYANSLKCRSTFLSITDLIESYSV